MAIDIESLRRRHCQELVGHAFRLLADPSDREKAQLDEWVDFLLQEGDVHELIDRLKARGEKVAAERTAAEQPVAETASAEAAGGDEPVVEEARADVAGGDEPVVEEAGADVAEAAPEEKGGEYRGSAEVVDAPAEFQAGMPETILVSIKNDSSFTWETTEEQPINASYHWLNSAGEMECFDGLRTPLEGPIAPGESHEVDVRIEPPSEPGEYELVLTMVHEGVTWFEEEGFRMCKRKVQVDEYSGYGLTRHAKDLFQSLNRRAQVMEVAS